MGRNRAFTIIELIIYIAIFSIFSLLIFSFIQEVIGKLNTEKIEEKIKKCTLIDLMRRDLMSASTLEIDWDEKNFVFKKKNLIKNKLKNEIDIGWKFTKSGSYRIEGNYDYYKCKWYKKIVSRVNYLYFKPKINLIKREGLLRAIEVFLDNKNYFWVLFRNEKYEK